MSLFFRNLILLVLGLISTPVYSNLGANSRPTMPRLCQNILDKEALFPIPEIHASETSFMGSGYFYYALGAGSNGRVRAVQAKNQNHVQFVEKIYESYAARNTALTDARLLELLRTVKGAFPEMPFLVAKVLEVEHRRGRPVVTMGYVEGRTLNDLLTDPGVKKALKNELRQTYSKNLAALEQSLPFVDGVTRSQFVSSVGHEDFFPGLTIDGTEILLWSGGRVSQLPVGFRDVNRENDDLHMELIIKSDNILVEPARGKNGELKMWIIDPF